MGATVEERSLEAQLRDLGVPEGGVLLVHSSFRAVGPVDGGPSTLIAALRAALGPGGTLVMPTMTGGDAVFDPKATPSVQMGIVPETFWRQPGVLRSTHPGGSFAAAGPRAAEICADQPLEPPHGPDSPVGRVHALDGQVLLIGVGHSENTTLHLAEAIARVPYAVKHPTVVAPGVTVDIAETDHCCQGFLQAHAWMKGKERDGKVGQAHARLVSSRELVAVAVEKLKADPLVFLCRPEKRCEECDLARRSVSA